MSDLKEQLFDRDLSVEGFQSALKSGDSSRSSTHDKLQKSNIAIYHETKAFASLYSVTLSLLERL